MQIQFSHTHATRRAVAIVGDTLDQVLGAPAGGLPALLFNVTDQPSGSDIFSGLGTAGSDVAWSELPSATVSHTGVHQFTVAPAANGDSVTIVVVAFPAAVLNVPELLYADRPTYALGNPGAAVLTNTPAQRDTRARRAILRALTQEASLATAAAVLEASPGAPYYGCLPSSLGAPGDLRVYGGGW